MKKFDIPSFYRSNIISRIKLFRNLKDPRKKDMNPIALDFGPVKFLIPRHFGFCYGVENAIEISYKIIENNPDKRIFLLSEMIHNPRVNEDLQNRGVKFLMDTSGKKIIDWNELKNDDIVIIPAFGTTLENQQNLNTLGINAYKYNTTCPFVEKVWNRSSQLGNENFTIIIHGKNYHEETRATFSHSQIHGPSLIVRNIEETKFLADIMLGNKGKENFYSFFDGKFSVGFNPEKDLEKIGVVNQTTMLATETQEIADLLKSTMTQKYGSQNLNFHFADTRDTLCYATYDNQEATYGLLESPADFAIVVGGYNSSNTGHLVELCKEKLTTYFISSDDKILSKKLIKHFDIQSNSELLVENFIPKKDKVRVLLTSGASCPDSVVDEVLKKLHSFFADVKTIEEVLKDTLQD
jgi:4-hydroxy-3-methylbut-2-en-1-yl diphosphate reductase